MRYFQKRNLITFFAVALLFILSGNGFSAEEIFTSGTKVNQGKAGTAAWPVSVTQNVVADASNSSTTNLAAGATFTGLATSTLGVVGIQVSLKTDQNATVYVDQSPDGTNWDIVDSYAYYASIGSFGITIQAINSYVRVRVKNNGSATTTYLRLQTVLCPIVEALPRSLDENGHLTTAVHVIRDGYGWEVENTPMDEMRVVQPYPLVGSVFGSTHDPRYWNQVSGVSGNFVYQGSQVVIEVSTNATAIMQSSRFARYTGAASNRFRAVIRFPDVGTDLNYRRFGAHDASNGAYFEVSGNSTLSVVTRKNGTDTKVSSGSFNGVLGSAVSMDTSANTWEIYWTNSKVYFVKNSKLLHTVSADSGTWSNNVHLPIRLENVNFAGSTTATSMNVRVATITRLGRDLTQPNSYYQSGQTTGVQLKIGPGNMHGLVISGVINNSVITLYDGTSTAGNTLWSSGTMGANTTPFALPLWNMPFFTGLHLVISGANSNAAVVYE